MRRDKLRETLNGIMFQVPYSLERTKENLTPHLISGEEQDQLVGMFDETEFAIKSASARLQRLYSEMLAFAEDEPSLKDIDIHKTIMFPNEYEVENWIDRFYNSFTYPLLIGGSYGHVAAFNRSFSQPYMKKEEFLKKTRHVVDDTTRRTKLVPEDIEDLLLKMGLGTKEELAEVIHFLGSGGVPYKYKTRLVNSEQYKAGGIIHPLKHLSHETKWDLVLLVKRNFDRNTLIGRGEPNYIGKAEEMVENSFWPKDAEGPEEGEPQFIQDSYNREKYVSDFFKKVLDNSIEFLYEKSGFEILNVLLEFTTNSISEYAERKIEGFRRVLSAYGVSEEELDSIKTIFKKKLESFRPPGYVKGSLFGTHRLLLSPSATTLKVCLEHLSPSFRPPKTKSPRENLIALFSQRGQKHINEIDLSSEKESIIDAQQIIAKIDKEIALEIKSFGVEVYLPGLYQMTEQIDKSADVGYLLANSVREGFAAFNNMEANSFELEEATKNGNAHAIRRTVMSERFQSHGTIGFRNYNKILADLNPIDSFTEDSDSVSDKVRQELLSLRLKRRGLLQRLSEDFKAGRESSEELQRRANDPEFLKEMKEINKAYRDAILKKNQFWNPDLPHKADLFEKFSKKVLQKIYAEEEAFMTGKRDTLYDKSQSIGDKLGIEDLILNHYGDVSTISVRLHRILKSSENVQNLYIALSSPEEFNTIDKMHIFLLKLLSVTKKHQEDLRHYRLELLENADFRNLIVHLTGTKADKIEKLLSIANLIDNANVYIGDIVDSKYTDKMHLDVMQKVVQIHSKIDSNYNVYQGVLSAKQKLLDSLGKEAGESFFPKEAVDILQKLHMVETIDSVIEIFGLNPLSLSGESFQKSKRIISLVSFCIEAMEIVGAVEKYYEHTEPKHKALFKLNMETPTFRFRVLNDLDPYHFKVGIDTDCCQRIGGVGEAAAIDSFVNPLAGVVILEIKNNGEWDIAAQSYFHYVPKKNLIILDNIESIMKKKTALKLAGYPYPKMYLALAQHAKSQGIDELIVGKEYTDVISGRDFEKDKRKKDPRSFSVEDPYSDYSPKSSYDLMKPKFDLDNPPEIISTQKVEADTDYAMLKIAVLNFLNPSLGISKLATLRDYLELRGAKQEANYLNSIIFSE